jgi:trehalose 6-phosphate phosphatase
MRLVVRDNSQNPVIEDFFQRSSRAKTARLLLDYDGTLAPFHLDRFKAYPYPGIIPLLNRIIQAGRTKISIITGRPIREIQDLLAPLEHLEIWGAHGMEHVAADGTYVRASIDPEVAAILHQAEDWLRQSGLLSIAEVKPGGIAVHWRSLPATKTEEVLDRVQKGWSRFDKTRSIKLLLFDGGIELRATHPDKGDAIDAILAGADPSAATAFLGDDLTDEDAFRALRTRGLSVLVRSEYRETNADVWLQPPGELVQFLNSWLKTFS